MFFQIIWTPFWSPNLRKILLQENIINLKGKLRSSSRFFFSIEFQSEVSINPLSVCCGSGRTMSGSVKDVKSKAELDALLRSDALVILHFWASWCDASNHMDQVFSHLATDFPHAHFLRVGIYPLLVIISGDLYLPVSFYYFDCSSS